MSTPDLRPDIDYGPSARGEYAQKEQNGTWRVSHSGMDRDTKVALQRHLRSLELARKLLDDQIAGVHRLLSPELARVTPEEDELRIRQHAAWAHRDYTASQRAILMRSLEPEAYARGREVASARILIKRRAIEDRPLVPGVGIRLVATRRGRAIADIITGGDR